MKNNKLMHGNKRIVALALSASLIVAQPASVFALEGSPPPDDLIPMVSGAEAAELHDSTDHMTCSGDETGEDSGMPAEGGP